MVLNLQDLVNGVDWIRDTYRGKLCIELDIDRQSITVFGTPAEVDALIRMEVEKLSCPDGGLMMIFGLYPGTPLKNSRGTDGCNGRYAVGKHRRHGSHGVPLRPHAVSGFFRFAQLLGDGEVFLVETVGRIALFRRGQARGDAGEPHFERRDAQHPAPARPARRRAFPARPATRPPCRRRSSGDGFQRRSAARPPRARTCGRGSRTEACPHTGAARAPALPD